MWTNLLLLGWYAWCILEENEFGKFENSVIVATNAFYCHCGWQTYLIQSSFNWINFILEYYERLFKDVQSLYQCEGATGLLLLYPKHCVHVVEVKKKTSPHSVWNMSVISYNWTYSTKSSWNVPDFSSAVKKLYWNYWKTWGRKNVKETVTWKSRKSWSFLTMYPLRIWILISSDLWKIRE